MLYDNGLDMALPKGIRTLRHKVTKNESRPDNVFISSSMQNLLISCKVIEKDHLKTDHYQIGTVINIDKTLAQAEPRKNWRTVEWETFRLHLRENLFNDQLHHPITDEASYNTRIDGLMDAIQKTIKDVVPETRPCSYSRRWWNKSLEEMRKTKKTLSTETDKYRALTDHPIHTQLRKHLDEYDRAIETAKKEHWESFLANASMTDLWTANGYIKNPVGDGGRPRIPSLKKNPDDDEATIDTNDKKAQALAQSFFPIKPDMPANQERQHTYEEPLQASFPISPNTVRLHIAKLAPFKAPGLDGIPNILLQQTADVLVCHLTDIFNASLKLGLYHQSWKESITCVLRKPGKPSYEIPKAYRPIALLSTIGKLLSSIVAADMSYLLEKHNLLPNNHFGGRPGRTTTDAIHYLVNRIKAAWRKGKVVSVLFLDIEGAFPNAVTEKVTHSLKKCRIPRIYVQLISKMLEGRRTKLKFDDYTSEYIDIDNGIGQGCPLSMLIYIIYNADLIEIPQSPDEDAGGYVDDSYAFAEATDFKGTVATIKDMMKRKGGGMEWACDYNSRFEMNKVAIMHYSSRHLPKPNNNILLRDTAPPLTLRGTRIKVVSEYKYLGVVLDPDLNWNTHTARTIEKGKEWIALFRRLSRTTGGLNGAMMKHLYCAVGLPRITYAAEVWYTPPHVKPSNKKRTGSVAALTKLQQIQRQAALAITGALRSTASDTLDVHAELMPIEILMQTQIQRSYIRLCTLPISHPLNQVVDLAYITRHLIDTHLSPIQQMAASNGDINPARVEKINPTCSRSPSQSQLFTVSIAETREESIDKEAKDETPVKIYTDGSGQDGQVGAAAVLYLGNSEEPDTVVHYHLSTTEMHSTYDAEWVGVLIAVWLLYTLAEKCNVGSWQGVSIYTDNQSVLKMATSRKAGPGQYLMEAFHSTTAKLRPLGMFTNKFDMKWISAHSNVSRNERVDQEAKNAAAGTTLLNRQLPPALRRNLPTSKSSLIQNLKKSAKAKHKAQWEESPRHSRLKHFDTEFPCKSFAKLAKSLTRRHATILIQIRTGHIPLNDYLFKRKLADTDICGQCQTLRQENITHFLFECPAYREARRTMDAVHGSSKRNLPKILSNAKHTIALLAYATQTERFTPPPRA